MCSNYEPIAKDRIHLLDLFEPTFEYKSHIYPNYEAPLLFSKKEQMEWRLARFGLVAPWVKELKKFIILTMQEPRLFTKSPAFVMHGRKINSA